ncbi:MAG: hypothetical protein ACFFDR_07225 [Candidatus Thorarchaeota archaeon]
MARGNNPDSMMSKGFSTVELLTKTLALWTRNLRSYIIIVGMVLALFTIVQAAIAYFLYGQFDLTIFADDIGVFLTLIINGTMFPEIAGEFYLLNLGISVIFVLLGLVVTAIVTGSAIRFALDDATTAKPDVGASMSVGFSKLVPMLILQIIIGLITGILLAPGQAFMAYGLVTSNFEMIINGISIFIVLGVVSLIIIVRIIAAPVILVVRDQSPFESLNSSFELTRGQTLHIAIGWILVLVVTFIIDFMISYFFSIFGFLLGNDLTVLAVTIVNNLLLAPIIYMPDRDIKSMYTIV